MLRVILLSAIALSGTVLAEPDIDSQYSLPNSVLTPGATNPDITPANFHEEICVKGAQRYRPSASYTNGLKKKQLRDYGYQDTDVTHFEEDHLIPLSLGGHPRDPKNLWPEPWQGEWGAHKKDELERVLYHDACHGKIDLDTAQKAFSNNWIEAYRRYVIVR